MVERIRVLLQTTIASVVDDWNISRFSLLREYLGGLGAGSGIQFEVDARDRVSPGSSDPTLSDLDRSDYDQLWLFAVDTGDGLDPRDCAGISRFRKRGGGLLVTRDHMDLGSSVCNLSGVGAAHYFHTKNPDPDRNRHGVDDRETSYISWPNYHSGANGDWQQIEVVPPAHALMLDPSSPDGLIHYLPAHPHEGGIGAPAGDPTARVIATGRSKVSGARFNIAVAFDASTDGGPAIAESTFHHFADYNWDPAKGCPSFVTEPPGNGLAEFPEALRTTKQYVRNIAFWLSRITLSDHQGY
jgi:hypothetical protein